MVRFFSGVLSTNTQLSPAMSLLELHSPALAGVVLPGQYCMLQCRSSQAFDPLLGRPYYVHGVEGAHCTFLVYSHGRGSRWLAGLAPTSSLELLGPLGHGWSIASTTRNLLLIAEEGRLPALTLLAQVAVKQEISVTILYHCPNADFAYPPALFSPEIEYQLITQNLVEAVAPYISWADALCCSVSRETSLNLYNRYDRLKQKLFAQGTAEGQVVCGNGLCLLCELETHTGPRLLCKDGPVFDLRDLAR
jgi:dihydroorotate dehydrogenase electron transfer subunit